MFVLNGPLNDIDVIQANKLTPVLNSLAQIKAWNARGPAGLHIDTGMNRLGIGPEELPHAMSALKDTSLALLMSHLACGSDTKHEFNTTQLRRFIDASMLFPRAPLSLAATAGALIGADYHFDLIRPGVGLYGSGGLDADNPQLSAAATIEAPILQVRDCEPGETFGYGVLGGAKRPILGRVSMDLIILDVTGCAEAQPGAMVEFLGPNAPLDDIAALAATAPYEILTTFAGTVRKTGVRA